MKIEEIRIGDYLCNKRTKFPMRVVGIYEDGTLYMDFDGNEGDVWEFNIGEVERCEESQTIEKTIYYVYDDGRFNYEVGKCTFSGDNLWAIDALENGSAFLDEKSARELAYGLNKTFERLKNKN